MTAIYKIGVDGGTNIYSFTESILAGLVLTDKAKVEFDEAFIAITGPNGHKFNIKGEFTYKPDTEGLPDTEFANLLGGTVTSLTVIQNPGILKYATASSFSIDVFDMLDLMEAGDAEAIYEALGAMKFTGAAGGDVSKGSSGDDLIFGEGGDDTLSGGSGDDEIHGGNGADLMTGGTGIDTLSYRQSATAVSVNLTGAAALGAAGDSFSGFENLDGSDFADKLTGDQGANVISGFSGKDVILGGGGADTLVGGADDDTASYAGSSAGVIVNLLAGTGTGGDAQGDTLVTIENVTGSAHDDTLTGSNGVNVLDGGRGHDTLDGGLGGDTLIGRSGRDVLFGGNGNDILNGGGGNDSFVMSDTATSTDTITRFVSGRDVLQISAADFKGDLVAGQDLFGFQLETNTTGDASSRDVRFVFNSDTGELTFDSNGSGEEGARVIATLQSFTGLTIADFDIV